LFADDRAGAEEVLAALLIAVDSEEEIQCNHYRPNLNYPKEIASRCQPSQQFENWYLREDNCRS
jgi:hypothetical protein